MKNLFKSQSGFSLVQGMILSGILAGSALVATKMLTEQKKVQKSAETRDQIEDLHKVIYSALQNRKNCERTVFSHGVQAQMITTAAVNLDRIVDLNSQVVVNEFSGTTPNVYGNGNVIVKNIQVVGYNSTTGKSNLEITYERMAGTNGASGNLKRTKDGFGAKEIKKIIPLRIQRDPFITGKPFESCYATTDAKVDNSTETGNTNLSRDLCLEMNSNAFIGSSGVQVDGNGNPLAGQRMWIWDETTSTCIPNAKCPDDQVYTGIDSNGDVKCRSLSDWGNFDEMFQSTDGTCAPGQTAKIEVVSENPVRVRIKCQ